MTDEPSTIAGAATHLGKRLIENLPAGYLAVLAVNMLFLGFVLWFLERQTTTRTQLLSQILESCLKGHSS